MFFTVVFIRTNIGQQLVVKLWRFMREASICHLEFHPEKIFRGVKEVLTI